MKEYIKPELELVIFASEVITDTSGGGVEQPGGNDGAI